ncbi:ATP-binding cassette sub-family A member 5 [Trichoplax sp. H2]|nr:ATP-binding cassette sub-family A member 5 [Trichoplax sp. H2]|eukprot:RDD39982.1 ATP-binding cassette sub-family A member 5 [Trichoplax sp. H2]
MSANAIKASISSDTGAVITTHSMEEADALCSRVAIMVRGQLRCLGSTQHLKNKHGGGYHLEIKYASNETTAHQERDSFYRVNNFVKTVFPNAAITEHFSHRIVYKIPSSNVTSLANSFSSLEADKTKVGIVEYSFSQSSLEQVFLEFAKKQEDKDEVSRSRTGTSNDIIV